MLTFSVNTLPNIAYAVNCYARYMFGSGYYYYFSVKIVVQYLKAKIDKVFLSNPSSSICKVYFFTNTEFSGIYGHENPTDTLCVKSRTDFLIIF